MDGTAPQPSPLLLQLSNTASNEARRHWLLEKRLTAPLPGAAVELDAVNQSGEGVETAEGSRAKRARLSGLHLPPSLPAFQAAWPESVSARAAVDSAADVREHTAAASQAVDLGRGFVSGPASRASFPPFGASDSSALVQELTTHVTTLRDSLSASTEQARAAEVKCEKLQLEADELRRTHDLLAKQSKSVAIQLATKCAELERAERRHRNAQEGVRLGCVALQRVGVSLHEVWEEGPAFWEVGVRLRANASAREEVELARKALKRRVAPPGTPRDLSTGAADLYVSQEEYMLTEEGFKIRVAALRKEEEALSRERERLERDKTRFLREVKRLRDEDASRFSKTSVLGSRYVLQHLLGRGGFSEVFKAYDVDENRYVACKIHQLVPQWTEEHKRSYVRHAAREYSIMKRVKHECIVRLFDVFEIDSDSFCTVLELCDGDDLDAYLKTHGSLAEREARVITAQIFSGLAYLSSAQRRVIHYDLKPGNVLFDSAGRVKITDFGLSKVMEEAGGSEGLELTSQGAGTYWYLPPECFQTSSAPPKISSKVDVWSAGVIFFQMLYGRRPFGHELTQEAILRDETILRGARNVDFPAKPVVSNEAKAFIRRCLTYNQADRPDVLQAAGDAYLSFLKAAANKQ